MTEPEPAHGVALPVRPGVRRIVAANPGLLTYHGTNTYLVDTPDGVAVLDPGPDDPAHVAAILASAGGRVALILVSHTHRDHYGAAVALRAATGAPLAGFRCPAADDFVPDRGLADGDTIAGLTALHTPGHAPDHLCFARPAVDGAVLFSADHVMAWSTSVVSPPGGDMVAYIASLRLLLARDDAVYLPGHGPPVADPRALVRALLAHRLARERAIVAALAGQGGVSVGPLTDRIYGALDLLLRRAAERTVLAHLLKLEAEGRAMRDGNVWLVAPARPAPP